MNAVSWLDGLPASDKWRTVAAQRGPLAVTCLLALALAMQGGFMVTDLTGGITGWTGTAAAMPVPTAAASHHMGTNVALITNAHLFGVPPVVQAPVQDAANAPQSTSPLLLTGVLVRESPKGGLAIIGQAGQATRVYKTGETVPGGAILDSVYDDRAVIDRNGHLEALLLPRQSTGALTGLPPLPAIGGSSPAVAERMRLLVNEPGAISDIMRPVMVRGQGIRVFPGRNHQAFSSLGLHPGDIISAVNGTPLDDVQGAEILKTLETSPEAHVTVMRNGQAQDLSLNVAQVLQQVEAAAGQQPQGAPQGAAQGGMQGGAPGPMQLPQAQPARPPLPLQRPGGSTTTQ